MKTRKAEIAVCYGCNKELKGRIPKINVEYCSECCKTIPAPHTPTSSITAECGDCSTDRKSYQVVFCSTHARMINSHEKMLVALTDNTVLLTEIRLSLGLQKTPYDGEIEKQLARNQEAIAQAEGK